MGRFGGFWFLISKAEPCLFLGFWGYQGHAVFNDLDKTNITACQTVTTGHIQSLYGAVPESLYSPGNIPVYLYIYREREREPVQKFIYNKYNLLCSDPCVKTLRAFLAACPRTSDAAGETAMESSAYWWSLLGVLVADSLDFNFLGFYMNYNKEAKSLTFRRGSEVSQVLLTASELCSYLASVFLSSRKKPWKVIRLIQNLFAASGCWATSAAPSYADGFSTGWTSTTRCRI